MKRRDATRVIYEILALARRGSTKTRIVHGANLNFRLAERYLSFLLEKQLLTTQALNETKLYKLTESGEHLLLYLSEVEKELTALPVMQTRRHQAPRSQIETSLPQ